MFELLAAVQAGGLDDVPLTLVGSRRISHGGWRDRGGIAFDHGTFAVVNCTTVATAACFSNYTTGCATS